MKSKSIFVFIIFMVNIASPAIADEDSIFEGSRPINVTRVLEVSEDLIVAEASNQVNVVNIADNANISKNIDTWESFKNYTKEDGSFVGPGLEENLMKVNDSGAVIVSGLLRAPSNAIMSGASEGYLRIPLNLNVNETYKNCGLTFQEDYQIPNMANQWLNCSQNLDIRMQIYHIGNPEAYELNAEGYPQFCCKWSSDYHEGWSDMELFDSYYEHSIAPLAHPTKVWDQVYRYAPKDDKCSPRFSVVSLPISTLSDLMPEQIANHYGNVSNEILPKCRSTLNNGIPLMGDQIRYDIDNRTYLWWSFPWYPDEHYAYIIETNNSMIFPEIYWTSSDIGEDGRYTSYLKLEDNMHHNLKTLWENNPTFTETCQNLGYFNEPCNNNMTYNNITLPVDLGTSVLFTQGHGYGVRGFNISSSATVYHSNNYGINTGWGVPNYRTPLNGIMFYDRLSAPFDSSEGRLTFTMPFSLPDVPITNTTDFEEKAIVTTCVQGLDDSLSPISNESWTCNQQVASDHVIISGRDTDVNTTANILNAQHTWGYGICYDHHNTIVPASTVRCNEYEDYGIWVDIGGGYEDTVYTPERAASPYNGDEFLNGSTYLKYWMSFEYYDPPILDPSGVFNMSPQCQLSPERNLLPPYEYFHVHDNIACRGDGTRIWLYDHATEAMDEDSDLINSLWTFQGGNLSDDHTLFPPEEGYFNHADFRQTYPPLNAPVGQPLFTESYRYANNISKDNNSINLRSYNWRPYHTTEITDGTLANLNPVQTGTTFEFHLTIVHDNKTYTDAEAWEIVPSIVKGIEGGDIMLDSFNFRGTGIPLQFTDEGLINQRFKDLYNFVDQTTKQCESLDPTGNGVGGFCKPGMLNWQARELITLSGIILERTTLPNISEFVDFIVNRIEQNINALLEVILFVIPFTVFVIGVAVIWHATRMLIYLIRGELEKAQELADLDRYGLAGISKAFKKIEGPKK